MAKKETKEEQRLLTLLQKEKSKVRKLQKENRDFKDINANQAHDLDILQQQLDSHQSSDDAYNETIATEVDTKGQSTTEHDPEEVTETTAPINNQGGN